jgi:hypothetical protein
MPLVQLHVQCRGCEAAATAAFMRCRFQPLTPKIAATALHALEGFVTNAVRCRKTPEPHWSPLFTVISSDCLCFQPCLSCARLAACGSSG